MPIATPAIVDDVRLYALFVTRTLTSLEKIRCESIDQIPIANIFRYLEQYRYDTFDWSEAHKHENIFGRVARKRAEKSARSAIRRAAETVFPGESREKVALRMEYILNRHAEGKDCDRREAITFLTQLQIELEQERISA